MNLQEQPLSKLESYGFQLIASENQDVLGTTYKAIEQESQKTVTIRLFSSLVDQNPALIQALENYSQQMGKLNHTNIQRVLGFLNGDSGNTNGVESVSEDAGCLLVKEYIAGTRLDEYLRRSGILDWQYAVRFLRQILTGLVYAHDAGFVHRSLAPHNLFVTRGNTIKITNMGLAHLIKETGLLSEDEWNQSSALKYAAPEAFSDEFLTANKASDIYSVGLIAYEMLTGIGPNSDTEDGYSFNESLTSRNLTPLHHVNESVPEQLSEIIHKALEHHAIHRFSNAVAMLDALDEIEAVPMKPSVVYHQKSRIRPSILQPSPATILLFLGAIAMIGSAYFYIQSKNQNPFVALQSENSVDVRLQPSSQPTLPAAAGAIAPEDSLDASTGTGQEIALATGDSLSEIEAPEKDLPNANSSGDNTSGDNAAGNITSDNNAAGDNILVNSLEELYAEETPESETISAPSTTTPFTTETPSFHTLIVRSRPSGAAVSVGGKEMGRTPFQMANLPGPTARVSISLPGYRQISRDIALESGKITEKVFDLTPVNRRIVLSVFPWGNIYLDGDLVAERISGTDTLMISPTHKVLRVRHPSFGTWETSLDKSAGESLNFTVDFRERASLSISAFDENKNAIEGSVFINGRDLNLVTPVTIELPLGNHLVEVRATGFEPIKTNTTIDLNRGQPQPLNLQMKRTAR